MPDIRPVSDLRKDFKGIDRTIRTTGGPIFLTSNGRPSMVVMSNELYDQITGGVTPVLAQPDTMAEVISKLRDIRDFSVEDMAQKTNMSVADYCAIEKGDKKPDTETLNKIADALSVSPSTLDYFQGSEGHDSYFQKMLLKLLDAIAGV